MQRPQPAPSPAPPPPQADELKDKLLRTLADMENLRERTARTTAETKQFAVQVGAGAWALGAAWGASMAQTLPCR